MRTYVVRSGDTLGGIAWKLFGDGSKWKMLAEFNRLADPDRIVVGQSLEVPGWAPGRVVFPMKRVETEYYRFGSFYGSGRWNGLLHPGVDWHVREGAGVRAVGDGIVRVSTYEPAGYGFYVMVEHLVAGDAGERVWSLYAHMARDGPRVGTEVEAGEVIGLEGVTGAAGVPHVHFELKRRAELGLYRRINEQTLREWWYDPQVWLADPGNRCVPVGCWGCPHRGEH